VPALPALERGVSELEQDVLLDGEDVEVPSTLPVLR